MSFDEALEHYKTHHGDWTDDDSRRKEDNKAMEIILLEFAKTDYLKTKQFEAFEAANTDTKLSYFAERSTKSGVIHEYKDGKEQNKIETINQIFHALHRARDKKSTIKIGSKKLNNKQVENLLNFYKELDPKQANFVLQEIKYGFTQLKF